jgi:hypothetical protein
VTLFENRDLADVFKMKSSLTKVDPKSNDRTMKAEVRGSISESIGRNSPEAAEETWPLQHLDLRPQLQLLWLELHSGALSVPDISLPQRSV